MNRRRYIKATGAVVTGSVLAGCAASGTEGEAGEGDATDDGTDGSEADGSETGTLATSVTDQPIDIGDFESCVITIEGIWVKPASDGTDRTTDPDADAQGKDVADAEEESEVEDGDDVPEGGKDAEEIDGNGAEPDEGEEDVRVVENEGEGRRYIEFDEPQKADLVELQGANTQLIDETELAVGEYRYLQLDVSGVEGVLRGGGEAEVVTPGNAPLQFKHSFEIRAGERTRFVADFAPVRRGQGDRYLLRPVATGTRVLYGDEEYDPEDGEDSEGSENDEDDGGIENDEGDESTAGADGDDADGETGDGDEN